MTPHEICPTCQPKHVLQPHEKLCNHGPGCGGTPSARADKLDHERIGTAIGNRRFDSNDARADMLTELAKLDPRFNAAGRSDDYVRARLDAARESQPGTADAAAAAARHRNAEAWKPAGERTDAASKVDPDEAQRRMKKRNEEAWKGKDGVDLLKQIEGDDTDENGIGAFGMRHKA